MSNEIIPLDGAIPHTVELTSWDGAAVRGLQARQEREAIIAKVLKPDADFGIMPGTTKPTLMKPGAEKIIDCLNLCPDYERLPGCIENFDKPLFHYVYRCRLIVRGSDVVIATGVGSCNSMEQKYRWRKGTVTCPQCGKATVIKGKQEYGGGYLCWTKKGGCGAKFPDGTEGMDAPDRVPNEDICDQTNTIDKMAQKRALVAAVLNLGFSEQFTQDMEDMPHQPGPPDKDAAPVQQPRQAIQQPQERSTDVDSPWTGFFDTFNTRTGMTNKKPWTLYLVNGADGVEFATFDEKMFTRCQELAETGTEVSVEFLVTKKGYKNIVAVTECPNDAA